MNKKLYFFKRGKSSLAINRLKIVLGILIFRFSLDFLYYSSVYPLYNIYGFELDFSNEKYIISLILLLIASTLLTYQIRDSRPSSSMILFLFLLSFIPNTSLFANMNLEFRFIIISFIYWIVFCLAYWIIPKKFYSNSFFILRRFPNSYKFVAYAFLMIIIAFSFSYNGLRINLDLSDVYEMRLQSRALGIPKYMHYIMHWSGNVIFPLFIIKMVLEKKLINAGIFIVGELVLFSIIGLKTWLFILAISIVWILFIKVKDFIFKLPMLFFLINLIGYLEFTTLKSSFFMNHFTRRVFFSTSLTNWYYLDFFNNNSKLLLTDSAFGWIKRFGFIGPYNNEPISRLIGRVYYNNIDMNASSGTIADAYANFGWLGILIYPFVLMLIFRLMDKYSQGVESRILIPIIVSMTILLLNGNIFSVMTTYGYIFALMYLLIYPKILTNTQKNGGNL
jgi:hypothetical protein